MATDYASLPELSDFRGAFGRLCMVSAIALKREGVSREAVRQAFMGEGNDKRTADVRAARLRVNNCLDLLRFQLGKRQVSASDATKLIVEAAREARDAVQGEWGHALDDRWIPLQLPIVNPHP